MSGNKGRNTGKTILLFLISLIMLFIAEVPYIDFAPGSFLNSVMTPVHTYAFKYLGIQLIPSLRSYALLPVVLLFVLLAFLNSIKAKKATSVVYVMLYAGLLTVSLDRQICKVPVFIYYAALAFIGLFVLWTILKLRKIFRNFKVKKAEKPVQTTQIVDISKSEKELEFERAVAGMKHEDAIAIIADLPVPVFVNYPNWGNASTEAQNTEETEHSKIHEIFNYNHLQQMLKEDVQAEFEFVEYSNDQPDLELSELPQLEAPSEPEPKRKPVFSEVRTREISEVAETDYSEDENLTDEDMNREKSTSNSIDVISGVGGLKRAQGADYYYNPKKYVYNFPSESYLKHYPASARIETNIDSDLDGRTIVETLTQFKIDTKLVGIQHGPTFTLYELVLAKGIRVNSVLGLADNIAMELAVQSVRILAPIPGKNAIGIEVPNRKRDTIGFDEMMDELKSKTKKLRIPMVLGKTITGEKIVVDLASAPHMLIAGTTGSGKSVCVNSLICSVLYTKTPKDVRMILVDPKMVELTVYNDIPHLLTPVITDPKKAIKVMAFVVEEMQRRMAIFSMLGARKIEDYNQKIQEKNLAREKLPYIMVIVDEFADLMMVVGKELESYIKRITAVARFTGIHLVLATQRPSADVITGIIKSNMPTQIAFAVSNQLNSRIILDSVGAEKLLGRGDMLYASASNRIPQRIQGAYIDQEIEQIVSFVKTQGEPDYIDESFFEDPEDEETETSQTIASDSGEDLFTRAWKIVAERGEASASYLQRKLSIGYNRAATLIEQLEDAGYIGPPRGAKPREILKYPDGE